MIGGASTQVRAVRDVITASWQRSLDAGVAADAEAAPLALSGDRLQRAREQSPLASAVEAVMDTLGDMAAGHVVGISDADARLLWVLGEPSMVDAAKAMGFEAGADWSESATGTNAVGTAAAVDHSVQVFSAEHFVEAAHDWTCSAAPIHDPETGQLIGVVDLTSPLQIAHPYTLSLANLAAKSAEVELHMQNVDRFERLRHRWVEEISRKSAPSALLDRAGNVIATRGVQWLPRRTVLGGLDDLILPDGRHAQVEPLDDDGAILWIATAAQDQPPLHLDMLGTSPHAWFDGVPSERRLRALEILTLLALNPGGLTAEQLALGLYGERGRTVTVRAQVHRLRMQIGEQAITTQPYRLAVPVEADWLEVERLIGQGRPSDALDRYPGPLLPESESEPVVELRGWLEESLRRSILTTGDPELLLRWLSHPSGAHDLAAARTLINVLPPGDPRRASATARATLIGR
ncbi:MAG: GAF domain-containing protein [Solirubrobacterales bacterium]|nr:GAF domain-containing protein [Solirubrobacterales bacterium]